MEISFTVNTTIAMFTKLLTTRGKRPDFAPRSGIAASGDRLLYLMHPDWGNLFLGVRQDRFVVCGSYTKVDQESNRAITESAFGEAFIDFSLVQLSSERLDVIMSWVEDEPLVMNYALWILEYIAEKYPESQLDIEPLLLQYRINDTSHTGNIIPQEPDDLSDFQADISLGSNATAQNLGGKFQPMDEKLEWEIICRHGDKNQLGKLLIKNYGEENSPLPAFIKPIADYSPAGLTQDPNNPRRKIARLVGWNIMKLNLDEKIGFISTEIFPRGMQILFETTREYLNLVLPLKVKLVELLDEYGFKPNEKSKSMKTDEVTSSHEKLIYRDEKSQQELKADEPWNRIRDHLWDRTAVELWHKGYTSAEIGNKLFVSKKRVTNRLCELRASFGVEVVPYDEDRKTRLYNKLRDFE